MARGQARGVGRVNKAQVAAVAVANRRGAAWVQAKRVCEGELKARPSHGGAWTAALAAGGTLGGASARK